MARMTTADEDSTDITDKFSRNDLPAMPAAKPGVDETILEIDGEEVAVRPGDVIERVIGDKTFYWVLLQVSDSNTLTCWSLEVMGYRIYYTDRIRDESHNWDDFAVHSDPWNVRAEDAEPFPLDEPDELYALGIYNTHRTEMVEMASANPDHPEKAEEEILGAFEELAEQQESVSHLRIVRIRLANNIDRQVIEQVE